MIDILVERKYSYFLLRIFLNGNLQCSLEKITIFKN